MPLPSPAATAAFPLRRLTATRYVTPLREGGSVPAVVEADDGALWVAKFRAAAQGGRVLAAELIVGELAASAARPFARVAEHVLLPFADGLPAAGAALAAALGDEVIDGAVAALPDEWLVGPGAADLPAAYRAWLRARRAALPQITEE